jgi:hypothetical protein
VDAEPDPELDQGTIEGEEREWLAGELSRLAKVLGMSAADKRAVAQEHCGTPTPNLTTCDVASLHAMVTALRTLEASKLQRETRP